MEVFCGCKKCGGDADKCFGDMYPGAEFKPIKNKKTGAIKMNKMTTAPKDGRFVRLHRRKGDIRTGRYAEKMSLFRKGKQWLDMDGNFIDIKINPIIGWDKI